MIIEFTGLPGSGKTTTVKELIPYLEQNGYECLVPERKVKIRRYLDYLRLDNLKLRYLLFLYSKRYVHLLSFIYFSNWFLDYYNFYKLYQAETHNKMVLVEQGLMQLLISIPFTQSIKNGNVINRIIRYINKQSIMFSIVYCKSDTNTVYHRLRERGVSGCRIDSMDEKSMESALKMQEQNFSLLLCCIKEVCGSVIEVDSKESIANKIKRIADYLGVVDDSNY